MVEERRWERKPDERVQLLVHREVIHDNNRPEIGTIERLHS